MARGGPRQGAGRRSGSPNRITAEYREAVAKSGLLPLDYMLSVLRDENATEESRRWAASQAAPYLHPKLAAIEHTGKDGGPIETTTQTDFDVARAIGFALAKGVQDKPTAH